MENALIPARQYDYDQTRHTVIALRAKYPFIRLRTIGKSVQGRDLFALEIGQQAAAKVLYAAAFHGTESITCPLLMRFCERACHAIETGDDIAGIALRRALFGRGMVIVPMVNPDGCSFAIHGTAAAGKDAARLQKLCGGDFSSWNANARGVDINHNFNAGWESLREMERQAGIFGPAPRQYGGPSPESEPETAALTALCRGERIRHALAFHSQGEEIYWHYGRRTPQKSQKMAEVFASCTGYALEAPIGLASHGGFKDWFIEEMGRPAFTFEVGKGNNPLPPSHLDALYDRLEETLVLAAIM